MHKKINVEIDYDFARKEYDDLKKEIEGRKKNLDLLRKSHGVRPTHLTKCG